MMNLLIIRERLYSFFQKWERFIIPVVRFLYTMIVFMTFRQLFGYNTQLYNVAIILGISFVCAFVPTGVIYVVACIVACLDVMSLSLEAAGLMLVMMIAIYLLYLRLVPGKSWVILVSMILLTKLPCCVPLLVAITVGPVGIIPAGCGVILYYLSCHIHTLQPLLTATTDDSTMVEPISFLANNMLKDNEMLLYVVVFSIVIMVTYLIYRSSVAHAWTIAIVSGTVLMILTLLAGSVFIETDLSVNTILWGSLLSGVLIVIVQFFKCIVDYGRVEVVQFEDDDYYYYVKAVPKVSIAQRDVNIKKINTRRHK